MSPAAKVRGHPVSGAGTGSWPFEYERRSADDRQHNPAGLHPLPGCRQREDERGHGQQAHQAVRNVFAHEHRALLRVAFRQAGQAGIASRANSRPQTACRGGAG